MTPDFVHLCQICKLSDPISRLIFIGDPKNLFIWNQWNKGYKLALTNPTFVNFQDLTWNTWIVFKFNNFPYILGTDCLCQSTPNPYSVKM